MTNPSPDHELRPIAARLRQHKQLVLQRWLQRMHEQLPATRAHAAPALVDHLPSFLDHLVGALSRPLAPHERDELEEAALKHGEQRARLPDYPLDQLIAEYGILRQIVFDVLEEEEVLPKREREVLLGAFETAITMAATEFGARSAAELRAASVELDRLASERAAQLNLTEQRFRTLVDVVKDYSIFTVDPQGRVTSWNSGAQRMKGYTAEEIIGKHFSILYPEEAKRREEPMSHLRTAAAEGRFRGEGLRVRKNGDVFLADVSITPMYEGDELRGFAKVIEDMSERSMLMQERDLSRIDIERLHVEAEYRERFVATLTHDLRAPLTAARAAAHLIARSPEREDRVRSLAVRIGDAVDRADRMVSDLLDATRIHAGEPLPLRFQDCDLRKMARDVCDDLSTRDGARFRLEVDGPTTGYWSADGLRRVLENLVMNAIKYGDPHAPITVRLRRVEGRELISVHNQGTIIAVEDQAKLFDMYHRTAIAQASGKKGWGLGLTLVRAIAEAHNGMVKVESYPIEGTTFTIDIAVDVRGSKPLNEEDREHAPEPMDHDGGEHGRER